MINGAAVAAIEGIPRNYEELFAKYGPFIANETRRLNVVPGNFDDLYQTICERLIHAKALEKFETRIRKSSDEELPETMSAEEACKLLGITFSAWRSKQWSFHKVFVADLGGKVPVDGKTHGTITRSSGAVVSWVAWMPTPISGGYGSPKAVYKTSDVLDVPACGYFAKKGQEGTFSTARWPVRKILPHHFMGYLARAIRNNWYNFCRTIRRKHRDRTGDCFPQFKTPDGDFNDSWEDTLPDTSTCPEDVENAIDYKTLVDDTAKMTDAQKGEIGHLLKSHSIVEAITLSSLSAQQKQVLLSTVTEG
jgi:DNA-directed RNA polymerase specialized sigma24 family protein